MGRKISVDSATMMNKALEVIEARYLFGVRSNQIEVVIHPQSVIHSMVQYHDNSVVAQMGTPDMRVPIAYGLSWPDRMESGASALDFRVMAPMTFESMQLPAHESRFPGLKLAWQALDGPVGTAAILNAANEVAVAMFLDGRIGFAAIPEIIERAMRMHQPAPVATLAEVRAVDRSARAHAQELARELELKV